MRAMSLSQAAMSSMLVDGVLSCGCGIHAKRSLSQVVMSDVDEGCPGGAIDSPFLSAKPGLSQARKHAGF